MNDDHVGESDSLMNTSMDEGSYCSEAVSISSPPRSARRFPASRPAGGGFGSAASRLFADNDNEEENDDAGPILKSLDLNMDLSVAGGYHDGSSVHLNTSNHGDRGARTPFRNRSSQKRQAERQLVARDLSFEEDVDDDEARHSPTDMMLQSPRMSPFSYRSPFQAAPAPSGTTASITNINKSPCYRTLDGRTVQSKNPFSPMYTDDTSACAKSIADSTTLADSLNFPVSLESSSLQGRGTAGPLLRHRLQKRDTNIHPSAFPSFAASAQYYTRDGYPEREGRYSFTGSPIREVGMETQKYAAKSTDLPIINGGVPHKVRRRSKQEDIPGAENSLSVSGESSSTERNSSSISQQEFKEGTDQTKYRQLSTLDMKEANFGSRNSDYSFYRWQEEISPTDVMNFPPSTPVPPTPFKPTKGRPKTHNYTPIRKAAVPPTPTPDRRTFGTSFDASEEVAIHSEQQLSSRFHSDFDVIGELGNGSFGNVFKVMSRLDGCMYAIKVAHRPAKGMSDKDRMLKEVYALAAMSDQPDIATFHIVRYHQAWMEEHRLYIQTELCTSTLSTEIQQMSPVLLTVPRRYKFLREICLALEFIHKNGMVHLDIKPENIFVKNDQFKLGDFGLVSKVSSHDVEEGDSRYMSLELLSGDHKDLTKSDVFSLGISLYEICLGGVRSLPTNGPEWQSLRAAAFHPLANTPDDMQEMIRQMMDPDVSNRPSASELLKRPHLLSEEQKALLEEQKKVAQANLALAERSHQLQQLTPPPVSLPAVPPRTILRRSNTWSGF